MLRIEKAYAKNSLVAKPQSHAKKSKKKGIYL